jgi:UDP-N-acetylglucosamine 3-dehydrogenase
MLRAGVIGTGNMGANHLRVYANLDNVELKAFAENNEARRQEMATTYGCNNYADYKEMVEKEDLDLVSIAAPTSLHYEMAMYCFAQGLPVLLEKPIALTLQHGQELLDKARELQIPFLVGHIERFNPAVKKLKQMIDNNELGHITSIIARRVGGFPPQIKDANIVVDLAIHDIDIINYLLDSVPEQVRIHKQRNHIEKREDSADIFMEYKSTAAFIQANWITPIKIRKLHVTGTEGYAELDYIAQEIDFYKSNYDKFRVQTADFDDFLLRFAEPDKMTIAAAKKEPLKEEIVYFVDCVQNGAVVESSFALSALHIALTH